MKGRSWRPKGSGTRPKVITSRTKNSTYVSLRWPGGSRYLGVYDPESPTCLLDVILNKIGELDISDLKRLIEANKSMRV